MGVGGNMSTTSTGAPRLYCVTRPNTGRSPKYELINELMQRFEPISKEEGEELWKEQLEGKKRKEIKYIFLSLFQNVSSSLLFWKMFCRTTWSIL